MKTREFRNHTQQDVPRNLCTWRITCVVQKATEILLTESETIPSLLFHVSDQYQPKVNKFVCISFCSYYIIYVYQLTVQLTMDFISLLCVQLREVTHLSVYSSRVGCSTHLGPDMLLVMRKITLMLYFIQALTGF